MNLAPTPVFDAVGIRQAREACSRATVAEPRAQSNTITSPRPQPYPLIRNTSSPYPSHAVLPAAHDPPLAASPPIYTSAASKEESVIDPELIALDKASAAPPTLPIDSNRAAADYGRTLPLDLPFQAPLLDTVTTISASPDLTPVAPRASDLLARRALSLHTALDGHRFSTLAGSSNTSYPSAPGSTSASQESSPVTPLSDDGQSAYDPGLSSPAFIDTDGEGGVPAPRVKPKKSHARKQPEGHVKRARNAFILFRKHITDSNLIPTSVEVKHQNISVVAAKMWKEAPQDVRAKFQEMARLEKEEHQRKYPNYRYQPVFRRTDIVRRRVRKDGAEDEKVAAVAEALIKGKAGGELEKEIKEQDLVAEEVDISPAGSAARSRSRRRRDPGQMSKGAMRAQKAQMRQKAMRQNLLGHNLLNMSLYNAQQQQQQQHHQQRLAAMAQHQEAHAYPAGQYDPEMEYLPAPQSYEYDGQGMEDVYGNPVPGGYDYAAYGPEYPDEMYHLPSIAGYDDQSAYADQYYQEGMELASPYGPGPSHLDHGYMPGYDMQDAYRLPPLLHHVASPSELVGNHGLHAHGHDSMPTSAIPGGYQHGLHARVEDEEDSRGLGWGAPEQQQTPSGHVMFSEGLFEGELGGMGMGGAGKEMGDGLGDFDEAIQQANETW